MELPIDQEHRAVVQSPILPSLAGAVGETRRTSERRRGEARRGVAHCSADRTGQDTAVRTGPPLSGAAY